LADKVKVSTEAGTDNKKVDAAQKRKRVKRIKTAIIITVIILFLLPTILCIILGIRLDKLQRQVESLLSTYSINTDENERKGTGGKYAYASTDVDVIKELESQIKLDNQVNLEDHEEFENQEDQDNQENNSTINETSDIPKDYETNEATDMQDDNGSNEADGIQDGTDTTDNSDYLQETSTGENTEFRVPGMKKEDSASETTEHYRDPNGIYYNKKVYLTFDDGPTKHTDEILDILAEYNVKATFFVVGRDDEKSLERYKRIVDEGHVLAIHSYSHKYKYIYESLENFDKDFTKLWNLLYDTTGYKPTLYRFPGGSLGFLNRSDMKEYVRYLDEKGMTYYDWNVVNGDAEGIDYTKEQMINNVLNGVAKKKTAIVLMHDGEGKNKTVATLPTILDALIAGGAEVLPLDETVPLIQQIKASSLK
jgi:peptidoglycan/xylan/chitin deacetylase (PgdA/CDA1 family)